MTLRDAGDRLALAADRVLFGDRSDEAWSGLDLALAEWDDATRAESDSVTAQNAEFAG